MSAERPFILYGAPGMGSVAVEAALTLIGLEYQNVDADPFGDEPQTTQARRYNALGQVPTLVLPGGEVMTESAAILIWLGDRYAQAGLAPRPEDRRRVAYLRWMTFIPGAIYWNYTVADRPERFTSDPAAQGQLKHAARARITAAWAAMERELDPSPHLLGPALTLLDLYAAVVSRWAPRRRTLAGVAPRIIRAVERVDTDPRLHRLWAERYPFTPGWDEES